MFPDWFPPPRLLLAAVEHGEVHRTHDPSIAAIGGSDLVTYRTGWGKANGPSGNVAPPGWLSAENLPRREAATTPWVADKQKVSVYDIK